MYSNSVVPAVTLGTKVEAARVGSEPDSLLLYIFLSEELLTSNPSTKTRDFGTKDGAKSKDLEETPNIYGI